MSDQVVPTINMFEDPVRFREGYLSDDVPLSAPDSTGTQLPYVLRAINVGERQVTRWELIRELSRQIPLDTHNLPQYIYRSDLLDPALLLGPRAAADPSIAHQCLNNAIVHLTWDQGFPTVHQEDPLWAKLQFEPQNAFDAFLVYASQDGIRTIHSLQHESRDLVVEWYHMFYWQSRAKALDMFRAAHHYRLREKRILDLEDNHWVEGEKIMKRIQKVIANKTDEELGELDIDKLISSMEKIAKIQRSSVGLSSNGGDTIQPKSTSVEVAIRNASEDGTQRKTEDDSLNPALFDDADLLAAAQDIIIKVSNK